MAIFGIATLVHIVMTIPFRAAYFIPLILGGICTFHPTQFPALFPPISNTTSTKQARHSATTVEHGLMNPVSISGPGLYKKC